MVLLSLSGCSFSQKESKNINDISSTTETNPKDIYTTTTNYMNKKEPQEFEQIKGNTFIFFGRVTCPYCVDFVQHELSKLSAEQLKDIVYIDTESSKTNNELKEIREFLDIKTVPQFIYISADGQIKKYDIETKKLSQFILKVRK